MTDLKAIVAALCEAVAAVERSNGETWHEIEGDPTAWDVGGFRVVCGPPKPGTAWGIGFQQQVVVELAVKLHVQLGDDENDGPVALDEGIRVGNAVELYAGYPAGVDAVWVTGSDLTRDVENPSMAEVAVAVTVMFQAAYAA